jgi:catechol 2,3-dioxygenase-like lactoylglutathione lyase family enzyme
MLADSRIIYLFIYVSDLGKSREFYADKLGLRVIEEDAGCVKFDCGHIILALNLASDHKITLPQGKDNSADIVFLVENLDATRAAIEARGVSFSRTDWYEPGGITDFYDPDGHWLTLYQPNEKAMGWPSGERIRAVLRSGQSANGTGSRSAAKSHSDGSQITGLDGSNLFYVFFFVKNHAEVQKFYQMSLGLRDLEGGPCSSGTSADSDGVIKYDTGGMLLTTHRIYEERTPEQVEEHVCPPREIEDNAMQSVAPVFHISHVADTAAALVRKGVHIGQPRTSEIGVVAEIRDPGGHLLYLYEPSAKALQWPSGHKIQEILAARYESSPTVVCQPGQEKTDEILATNP